MSKGTIYVMSTAVDGLVKIGKTNTSSFETRMYMLERNGYCNVTSLKREYAIEVENFNEKETLLHTIFEKSRLANTELFALDLKVVKELLSAFDGRQIYPKLDNSEEDLFSKELAEDIYTYKAGNVYVKAKLLYDDWVLLKGSIIDKNNNGKSLVLSTIYNHLNLDENGKLLEDFYVGRCSLHFLSELVSSYGNENWYDNLGNIVNYEKG